MALDFDNMFKDRKLKGGIKKMDESQTDISNWRNEIGELNPKLKILDGETKIFTFIDEGRRYKHPDYKPSIIFTIKLIDSDTNSTWFVNAEAYGLLNQIKALGNLKGVKVTLARSGSKKSDTRYTLQKM